MNWFHNTKIKFREECVMCIHYVGPQGNQVIQWTNEKARISRSDTYIQIQQTGWNQNTRLYERCNILGSHHMYYRISRSWVKFHKIIYSNTHGYFDIIMSFFLFLNRIFCLISLLILTVCGCGFFSLTVTLDWSAAVVIDKSSRIDNNQTFFSKFNLIQ